MWPVISEGIALVDATALFSFGNAIDKFAIRWPTLSLCSSYYITYDGLAFPIILPALTMPGAVDDIGTRPAGDTPPRRSALSRCERRALSTQPKETTARKTNTSAELVCQDVLIRN